MVNRYLLHGASEQNIEIDGELSYLAEQFLKLENSHFHRLFILDRETGELIRWDLFCSPTWYYPLGESCQLLVDWFQAITKVSHENQM